MQTPAVTSGTTTTSGTADRGAASLTSDDFFQILITELQNQDPLQPSSTSDMLNQVSQIRGMELSQNLNNVLGQLGRQQRTAGTSELLGKYVTATVEAGDGSTSDVSGIVTGVRFTSDGSAVLELDTGETVKAEDVTHVTTPEAVEAGDSADKSATAKTSDDSTTTNKAAKAKSKSQKLFPWLSLDGAFQL